MKTLLLIILMSIVAPSVQATSNLSEMWGNFRAAVGEQKVSTSSVDDTTVTRWINEGQFWVASMLQPIEAETTLVFSDTFMTVVMPVTFKSMRGAVSPMQGALIKTTLETWGILADTGYGTWFAHGRNVRVKSKELEPDLDTLRIYYYARPALLALAADTLEIDDLYHYLITDFVISRFELSRHFIQSSIAIRQQAGNDLEKTRKSRIIVVQSE